MKYIFNPSVGHNKLGTFMTEISRMAKLSHEYTNHSCRATTVHVLDEAQVPSRHIMSVTGHKFESSLKTYCNSNEDALLVLAPVFSSTSTVILLWDKTSKSILSDRESCSEILLVFDDFRIMITLVWAIINLEHL
jgi:hypothetical protein